MPNSCKSLILVLILLVCGYPVHTKYLPYVKIDSQLEKTWNESFPVPYRKILKRNINGKGILQYREGKSMFYIYTFHVAMPSQKWEDGKILPTKEERILLVKLFYEPDNKEKPYSIRIGELDEEKKRPGFIRYVN